MNVPSAQITLSRAVADSKGMSLANGRYGLRPWEMRFQRKFFRVLEKEAVREEKKDLARNERVGALGLENKGILEMRLELENALENTEKRILHKPAKRWEFRVWLSRNALIGGTVLAVAVIGLGRLLPEVEKIVEANLNFEFMKPITEFVASGFKGMLKFFGLPVRNEISNAAMTGMLGTTLAAVLLRIGPLQWAIKAGVNKMERKEKLFGVFEAVVGDYLEINWLPKEERKEISN